MSDLMVLADIDNGLVMRMVDVSVKEQVDGQYLD